MELVNATRMPAAFTLGLAPGGEEALVVVVKGTFTIPATGGEPRLAPVQMPLLTADVWSGEPGLSPPVAEADFAPLKRRCDVLVNGSAWAPGERPATRVPVRMQVGSLVKEFVVVGDRQWQARPDGIRPGLPAPFESMPLTYARAFGGCDDRHDDPATHAVYARNPVGCGWYQRADAKWVDGAPMPNTEAAGQPVLHPDEAYEPQALGPVARHWAPRVQYGGTYDAAWRRERFPFLPADFDARYYQCAPADQTMAFPVGGEDVRLDNLSARGLVEFALPRFDSAIDVFPKRGGREPAQMRLDTIVIEPDAERFTLTWRFARLLRRNLFEIAQVVVGRNVRAASTSSMAAPQPEVA